MLTFQQGIKKDELLNELKKHQKLDAFIQGTYGKENGTFKGCAVGCSIYSLRTLTGENLDFSNHKLYPEHLGIPEWLAILEDKIFEGISVKRSKTWPVEFIEAIHEGADLEKIKGPFLIKVLESCYETFDHVKYPEVKTVIDQAIELWKKEDRGNKDWLNEARQIRADAASATASVASTAANTAYSAYFAAAFDTASAAYVAAAFDTASVASAAASVASAAANTTYATYATYAAAAAYAARKKKYEYFADELLKLMRECRAEN